MSSLCTALLGFGWKVAPPLSLDVNSARSSFSIFLAMSWNHSRLTPPASMPSSPRNWMFSFPAISAAAFFRRYWKESSKTNSLRTRSRSDGMCPLPCSLSAILAWKYARLLSKSMSAGALSRGLRDLCKSCGFWWRTSFTKRRLASQNTMNGAESCWSASARGPAWSAELTTCILDGPLWAGPPAWAPPPRAPGTCCTFPARTELQLSRVEKASRTGISPRLAPDSVGLDALRAGRLFRPREATEASRASKSGESPSLSSLSPAAAASRELLAAAEPLAPSSSSWSRLTATRSRPADAAALGCRSLCEPDLSDKARTSSRAAGVRALAVRQSLAASSSPCAGASRLRCFTTSPARA
mmetsp:Transcript_30364/g.84888  ORF Transcript_30364/g.84888 Transcript_30364/m.84888 type:complete len:356 (-) Transcript_30364:7233-8300(-)